MDPKQATIAALEVLKAYFSTQLDMVIDGESLINARPSNVRDMEFWRHWICDVVDADGGKGYASCWEAIFLKMITLV